MKNVACKNEIFRTVPVFQKQNIMISRRYSVTYVPIQHSEFLVAQMLGNLWPSIPAVILKMGWQGELFGHEHK